MSALLVARRRARRDLPLLAAWTVLVAFAVLLAVAMPRLMLGTVDDGARAAVAAAGSNADVVVQAQLNGDVAIEGRSGVLRMVERMPARLPAQVRQVYSGSATTLLGPVTRVSGIDGTPVATDSNLQLQMATLTPANRKELRLVQGRLPRDTGSAVEVVLSAPAASAAGLRVGSLVDAPGLPGFDAKASRPTLRMRVVGIVAQVKDTHSVPYPGASIWQDTPNLWTPSVSASAAPGSPTAITVLAAPAGVHTAMKGYNEDFSMNVRLRLDSSAFSSALVSEVQHDLAGIDVHSQALAGTSEVSLNVRTGFLTALAGFRAQARAALAQMSVLLAGVLGVAAAVVLLLSRLLMLRREGEIALERARGASLVTVSLTLMVESVGVSVVGAAVGIGGAWLLIPGAIIDPTFLIAVLVLAVFAAPTQGILIARSVWAGKRVPANRVDRIELEKRRRARRFALEGTVVVLAVAALVSLRARGLLQTSTDGVDPFLASAPLLFAVVVTIVVLRVYRWPVRLIGALGRRSAGVLGILGAVRAARAIAVLPLLALTLAVALTVGGGLLLDTVRSGQTSASWQRVGADARVQGPVTPSAVSRVSTEKGVTAAGSALVSDGVQLELGTSTTFATMIAIDRRYPDVVERLPAENGSPRSRAQSLRKLAVSTAATDPLPVVVDSELAKQLVSKNVGVYYGLKKLSLRVIGITHVEPSGYLGGPFLYVDLASLSSRMQRQLSAHTLLITGPGAVTAASSLHAKAADIHSRATWLKDRRQLALVKGVAGTMTASTITVALLAMIALIATVLAGARERGRSLSLLRTLGLRARLGWWLALAELAPVVIAAVLGGAAAGIGMVLVLEPSMGMDVLAGGTSIPPPTIAPGVITGLVGATVVLLAAAVLVEVVAHRRDRLSEVLRVGETV